MEFDMTTETLWDESYSVGHPTLDSQHRRLLRICNELADCVEFNTPDSDSRFHEILNDLADYAREHFATEETVLKRLGYPHLKEHEQDHFTYIEAFTDILAHASRGMLDKAGTLLFLAKWWSDHILVTDMQYRSYIKSAGQS